MSTTIQILRGQCEFGPHGQWGEEERLDEQGRHVPSVASSMNVRWLLVGPCAGRRLPT